MAEAFGQGAQDGNELGWVENFEVEAFEGHENGEFVQGWGSMLRVVTPSNLSIRPFADKVDNVVHWSEFDRGGHFAALETPDLLTADVREFFRTLT